MAKMKIQTLEQLEELRQQLKTESMIDLPPEKEGKIVLAVGLATCGIAAGGEAVMEALKEEVQNAGIAERVTFVSTGCLGYCYMEPLVEVRMPNRSSILYGDVDPEMAREIVRKHLIEGRLLDKAIIGRKVKRA